MHMFIMSNVVRVPDGHLTPQCHPQQLIMHLTVGKAPRHLIMHVTIHMAKCCPAGGESRATDVELGGGQRCRFGDHFGETLREVLRGERSGDSARFRQKQSSRIGGATLE